MNLRALSWMGMWSVAVAASCTVGTPDDEDETTGDGGSPETPDAGGGDDDASVTPSGGAGGSASGVAGSAGVTGSAGSAGAGGETVTGGAAGAAGAAGAEPCIPDCTGRECGDDGCGEVCAVCPTSLACDEPTATCVALATTMAPARDDVRLYTRIQLPTQGTGPWPVLLVRTPYELGSVDPLSAFSAFTDDGYALVVQSCRGTGSSEGQLSPMAQEFADGHDAANWIAAQPWSDGNIGTMGGSYEAFTALAAGIDTPEVKVVISDGAPAHAFESFPGERGILSPLLWWLHLVQTGEDLSMDATYRSLVTNTRPLSALDVTAVGGVVPLWQSTLPEISQRSDFWDDRSLDGKLGGLCAAAIHFQARMEWADDALDIHREIVADPCDAETRDGQRYVLGSHSHGGAVYSPFAASASGQLIRDYLAKYLKGEAIDLSSVPAVQYYVQNADEWRSAASWPVATATRELFLDTTAPSGGTLGSAAPTAEGSAQYVFDPATDDGCDTAAASGYVLYAGTPLASAMDLAGSIEVVLHVSVDVPDTDLYAVIYEVTAAGDWLPIRTPKLRLRFRDSFRAPVMMPIDQAVEVRFEAPTTAYRVAAGSSVAVLVMSTVCGLAENPNTGTGYGAESTSQPATITILSGPSHPSRIRIPVDQ